MPFKDHAKALEYFRNYNKRRYPKIKWKYHNDPKEKARRIRNIRNYELRHKDKIREIRRLLQRKYRSRKKQLTVNKIDIEDWLEEWDDEDADWF